MHERTRLTAERGVSVRSAMLKRLDEPAGRRFAGTQRHQAPRHVGGVRGGAGRAVQLSAFLTAAGRIPIYGTLFTLIAKAGLRPSEARGLKPDDIDWHTRTVRIPRSLDPDNAEKPTKTYETRDVDLSAELATTLRQYLGWLDRHALTEGWEEPHWLFPGPDNKPLDESLVRRSFRRALKRAGVRDFSTYDLRHTYASLLLCLGAPLLYVSRQLGHKNATTTLKWYARWIPGTGERWVDRLDVGIAHGTTTWNQTPRSGTPGSLAEPEVPDLTDGRPSMTRTLDPLIKSCPEPRTQETERDPRLTNESDSG